MVIGSVERALAPLGIPAIVFTFLRTMILWFSGPRKSLVHLGLPLRKAISSVVFSLMLAFPVGATDFLIGGTTRLNTITVPNSGSHHIRFSGAGYQNPGSLTLSNNSSDSLIFESVNPTDSAVRVDSVLLHLKDQKGVVVFRGLAFKLNRNGVFFDTSSGNNHHLVFDGCTVLGDTVTKGKVFSWGGDGASTITLSNSMFSQTGALSLTGASSGSTINLTNNLFNFSGVLTANATSLFEMKYNTVNRTQLLLDGNFSATCTIRNNYFANPPAKNNLAQGGAQRFATFFKGGSFLSAGSSLSTNVRYSSWDGYDFYPPGIPMFSDPSNTTITPAKDSTVTWDWKIPGDAIHGAWNGPTPLPDFNFFPPDSTLSLSVPGGNAIFTLNASAFPRVISASFGTSQYVTALPDSARSWFGRDSTLVFSGTATVRSLTLPSRSEGRPLLFAKAGTVFTPGSTGSEGGNVFLNGVFAAKEFLPAFVGQNTFRGSNISVTGLSTDTALVFSTVTRSGRTAFQTATIVSLNKRWRALQKGGRPLGFKDTTNADASGDIRFGLAQTGVDKPYLPDSAAWWMGGNAFTSVTDSAGKYWGTSTVASSNQAVLIERLRIGKGEDTVALPQGRIVALSIIGHQLKVDSSSQPDQPQFPDMGSFSKGLSFLWPGRGAEDSFTLTLFKSNRRQKAYIKNGTTATLLSPIKEDSNSITLSLGVGDSGKVVFLARKYGIIAGAKTDLAIGQDSIKALLSTTPGEIFTDSTGLTSEGLPLSSSRFLGGRKIIIENLFLQGNYSLGFVGRTAFTPDSVHAYVLKSSAWTMRAATLSGGQYIVSLGAGETEVAILEGMPIFRPSNPPQASVSRSNLAVTPRLTLQEKERVTGYTVELISVGLDGAVRKDTSKFYSSDSTAQIPLSETRVYAYRVNYQILSGKENADTAWVLLDTRTLSGQILKNVPKMQGKRTWSLIGFPYDGKLSTHLKTGIENPVDSTQYLLMHWSGSRYDTLAMKDTRDPILRRGESYGFISTERFKPKIDSSDILDLKTFSMDVASEGWAFLTSAYPFPYPIRRIKSDGVRISRAMQLRDTLNAKGEEDYYWQPVDTLKPFEGYAIYVFGKAKLTFEPLPILNPAPAAKTSSGSGSIQITAIGQSGFSRAFVESGPSALSLPFLPKPASSLELSINGKLSLAQPSLHRVETKLILNAAEPGSAKLEAIGFADGSGLDYVLFNPRSGTVQDLSKDPKVELGQGDNVYRLIAGDKSYVASRTAELVSSLPRIMSLSQNFPNPFRGTTRIRYTVPAGYGRILKAHLEVTDLAGRIVQVMDLGVPAVGYYSATINAPELRAGIYVYRLFLKTSERNLRMQRRMTVLR